MDELRLRAARVATVFANAKPAYFATLANAGILLVVLWGPFTAGVLLAWFAALFAVTAARIVLHWRFVRAQPEPAAATGWERRYFVGALTAGATWAFAVAVFFPENDPLRQMALVLVVGGNVIGAAGVYAASVPVFYGFSALPFLAIVSQLVAQPGQTYPLIALMLLVFGAVMAKMHLEMYRSLLNTLRTQLRNQELLARLGATEGQLRDAIESFPDGIAIWGPDDRLVVCNDVYATLHAERRPEELSGIHQSADGRWWRGSTRRMRGDGYVGVVSDITDLKRAQESYLAVLAEENLMLDTLPVGVAFVENRTIVRCNRRLEQMLGYEPGLLAGKSARVLYPSEEAWRRAGEAYARLTDGSILEGEAELQRRDGTRFWGRLLSRTLNPDRPEESAIVAFSDVGDRRAAEQALKASEAMYRNLVETSSELIWSLDAEGRWSYLNAAGARRIYGREAAEMIGRPLAEAVARELQERDYAVFQRILAGDTVFDHETRHRRADGSTIDLSFNAIALRSDGRIVGATGTARDITERKRAAAALHENVEKLRLAVEAADLRYWEWDAASDGPERHGADTGAAVHPDDLERYLGTWRAAVERGEPYEIEYRVAAADGRIRWLASRGVPIRDAAGRTYRMIGVSQEITERKRREEEVRFLAYHDSLTGLPNRRLLDDRLKQAVYAAQRRDRKVAAMLIDLDDFKQVNDSLGHRAGDAVLREVAQRLAGCVRKADTLARHGGDEFVIVLSDVQLEADCQVVADKILRALETEFQVDGRPFRLGASVGISMFPSDAGDGDALLRNADAAMYRAKQLGRNQYRFYGR